MNRLLITLFERHSLLITQPHCFPLKINFLKPISDCILHSTHTCCHSGLPQSITTKPPSPSRQIDFSRGNPPARIKQPRRSTRAGVGIYLFENGQQVRDDLGAYLLALALIRQQHKSVVLVLCFGNGHHHSPSSLSGCH